MHWSTWINYVCHVFVTAVLKGLRRDTCKQGLWCMYGIFMSKRMQHAAAALENTSPCVPLFSHRVRHTLMAVPQCTPSCIVKMRCIHRIAARLTKSAAIPYLALPAQIQQTIKVWHVFLSKSGVQIVAFFLRHTVFELGL